LASPDQPEPDERRRADVVRTGPGDLLDRFEALCDPRGSERPGGYPTGLCCAAAEVLNVDAVGISLVLDVQKRIPVGASSGEVSLAERLEFTVGEGPCLTAYAIGEPVMVPDIEDHAHLAAMDWGEYGQRLLTRTSFKAVFCLPLDSGGLTLGTMCMYRRSPRPLGEDELNDALAVRTHVLDALLSTELSPITRQSHSVTNGSAHPARRWLDMPLALARSLVWQAIGIATVEMGLSSLDALAILRSYCYSHDLLLDDVVAEIVAGALPLEGLHP